MSLMRSYLIRAVRVSTAAYAMFLGLNAQAGPAVPAPEAHGVAAAFGNTVKALYPDGKHQHIWLKPDGTWEAIGRRGKPSAGKWKMKGEDKVCLKQVKPFAAPFTYCTDFPSNGGVGAVWASKDMTGIPIKITLVRGIEAP